MNIPELTAAQSEATDPHNVEKLHHTAGPTPSDIPAIRQVERDGNYFTLDNRRLAAFQEAGVDIPYRMATPSEIASQGWKFTTTNDGTSILIREVADEPRISSLGPVDSR